MATAPQSGTEREQLAAALRRSTATYLACVKSIPEDACSLRLNDNSWSILDIAEHVAVAEHGMFRAIELGTEKTSPPDYETDRAVVARASNRDIKGQAPERSRPKGRWKTLAEAIDAFEKARERSLAFVESGEKDLRKIESVHPLVGSIDGHQVLLIMAAHAERHTAQIEEIKATHTYQNAAGK